jgi:DNA-binding response OmpR family regulator
MEAEAMKTQRKTVLVVEDNPDLRQAIIAELSEMGLDYCEAGDARSAIEQLIIRRPDLACLDLVLPELSGFELCEFIRRSPVLGNVPILMMSGRSLPEDRALAEEAGASAYLPKPFTLEQFGRAVRALLGGDERGPRKEQRVA